MKEIKYTILYCVCEIYCDSIYYSAGSAKAWFQFRFRYGNKLHGSGLIHT
jgi:hypothetical protein